MAQARHRFLAATAVNERAAGITNTTSPTIDRCIARH
jgi:hypothetical protein